MFFLFSIFLCLNHIFFPVIADLSTNKFVLQSFDTDLTGNNIEEKIQLHGVRLAEDSNYFHELTLSISTPNAHAWKKTLIKGYDPSLKLISPTDDKQKYILYEIALNEQKTKHAYQLFQFNHKQINNIPLPKQENIQVLLKDNFMLEVKLPLQEQTHKIDISRQKKHLIENNIYKEDGLLMKQLILDQENKITLEVLFSDQLNVDLIKTTQEIKGITDEILGEIHTVWQMQNGKWIILQTEWQEINKEGLAS